MRRALQWLAVLLSIAWIVVIAGALPGPIGGPTGFAPRLPATFPDWREAYLAAATRVGLGLGYVVWSLWAMAVVALDHAPPLKPPLAARAWLTQLSEWGMAFSIAVAAVLPPWLAWWLARRGSRGFDWLRAKVSKRATDVAVGGTDPSLVVAGGWSAGLLLPCAAVVVWQLLHPVPSWLMLPPADGADVPVAEWCPYSLHARARECGEALDDARAAQASQAGDYMFRRARCVPAAEMALPVPHTTAVDAVAEALRRAAGDDAVVRRDARIGDLHADVIVERRPGATLLAVEVVAGRSDAARAGRFAAAGVSEYWQIVIDPSRQREPVVSRYQQPDATRGAFARSIEGNADAHAILRPAAMPDSLVPSTAIFAPVCPPRAPEPRVITEAAVELPRMLPARAPQCRPVSFVVDGAAPKPTLTFGSGAGFRFVAAASSPVPDFATGGLHLVVSGPLERQGVVDAILARERWTRSGTGWTYRDPQGRAGGVTGAVVRPTANGGSLWEVEGERTRDAVPADVHEQWGRIEVALAPEPAAPAGPCGSLYFHPPLRCRSDATGALRCEGPDAAPTCEGSLPDAATECLVRRVSHAEEVFFATHGRFASGSCADLPAFPAPHDVACTVAASDTEFSITAVHPDGTYRNGCRLESTSQPVCS